MKDEEQKHQRDKWRKIIDEYLQCGMTQKAFCEQRSLSLPQLVYYHVLFKKDKESLAKSSFVQVKIPDRDKAVITSEIKLSLPNGFQCSFPSHTDVDQIKRLIEVLLSC
jgi:hypothetical protein